MTDEVIDFPRGGSRPSQNKTEESSVNLKRKSDVLFGVNEKFKDGKENKKSKKGKKDNVQRQTSIAKKMFLETFSYKYLKPGFLLLGYVKESNLSDMVIGLANGLNGYIPLLALSEYLEKYNSNNLDDSDAETDENPKTELSLSTLLHVGQLVPVCVKRLHSDKHGYKKIELSPFPADVNCGVTTTCLQINMLIWGVVSSIEDHGYMVSFGLKDSNGFVPKAEGKENLILGQMRWFVVKKTNSSKKVLTLSLDTTSKSLQMKKDSIHFNSLLPGQSVKFVVSEVSEKLMSGKIFGSFEGIVESLHIPEYQQKDMLIGKKFTGRILHVNPQSKQIGISCLEKVLSFPENIISTSYEIGEIVKECVINKVDNKLGLFVELPNEDCKGNVHVSRITEEHIDKLSQSSKYKVGKKVKCRVLGYSALDSCYVLTMLPSDLAKDFVRYEDLKPGMIVSGTIITLEDFGCLVKITDHIRALLPKVHLADIILKHPEKKFIEEKKVKCRVLTVDAKAKKLVVTHKKTMINSEFTIITSYEGVQPLDQAHGFVSGIQPFGVFVRFYNNVQGLIPKNVVIQSHGISWDKAFYIGQVLQCTILTTGERKMTITLKDPDSVKADSTVGGKGNDVKFLKMSEDGGNISVLGTKQKEEALLPINHLSDFQSFNKQWKNILSTKVDNLSFKKLVVTGRDKKTKQLLFSGKNVLSTNNRLKNFKDLKKDGIYGGTVTHIMSYGCFVELKPGIVGLVPLSKLADHYVTEAEEVFEVGQSVIVKVTDIDEAKQRFLGMTVVSVLMADEDKTLNESFSDTNLLEICLKQRSSLHDAARKSKDGVISALPGYLNEVLLCKVICVDVEKLTIEYHDKDSDSKVKGIILASLKYGVNCEIGDELQAYVLDIDLKENIFMASFHPELIEDVVKRKGTDPIPNFVTDKKIDAIVMYVTNEYVILTVPSCEYLIVYMSTRKHLNNIGNTPKKYNINQKVAVLYQRTIALGVLVKDIDEDISDPKTISVGSTITATVKSIKPCQLNVTLANGRLNGRIHVSHIVDDIEEGENPLKVYQPMQTVQAKVIGFRDTKSHNYLPVSHKNLTRSLVELSIKPSVIDLNDADSTKEEKISDYEIGEEVICYVMSLTKTFVYFCVDPTVKGRMYFLNTCNTIKDIENIRAKFKPGLAFKATVIGHNDEQNCLDLSRTALHLELSKKQVLSGKISKVIKDVGLLVNLPNQKAGIVHLTEISTTFVEEPLKKFSKDDYVRCVVLNVKGPDKIDLSLRESRLNGADGDEDFDRAINSYDDLKEGDILRGYIKTCSKVGVFVSLSPSIIGRVQIKNISQYFVTDYEKLCSVGKLVKAKILSINPSNNQIDLSLRGKDVNDVDIAPPPKRNLVEDSDGEEENRVKKKRKLIENEDVELVEKDALSGASESEVDEEIDDDEKIEKDVGAKPSLQISSGFDWSIKNNENDKKEDVSDDSDNSDEDNSAKAQAKKTKRQKRAAKKSEEESLHKAELALLDTERQLGSAEDFDRVILGSPNSSIIWIQYMAFHLHMAEVDKARAVAEKALKTISFREEQEKLNVWVALLNLESMYGSEESLSNVMQDAIKVNDYKKITLKMIEIYTKNQKFDAAEKLYSAMLRKHSTKGSKSVWIGYAYFLAKKGEVDKARKLLTQALKSIPTKKHIQTIVQFAILEYKFGESQRGSTVFESILKNYPKRTDLWSIYIDMSIKEMQMNMTKNAKEHVRNIFERAITMNLSLKKMKFLFKRYMNFETQYGTTATVESVRKKAESYVENRLVDTDE